MLLWRQRFQRWGKHSHMLLLIMEWEKMGFPLSRRYMLLHHLYFFFWYHCSNNKYFHVLLLKKSTWWVKVVWAFVYKHGPVNCPGCSPPMPEACWDVIQLSPVFNITWIIIWWGQWLSAEKLKSNERTLFWRRLRTKASLLQSDGHLIFSFWRWGVSFDKECYFDKTLFPQMHRWHQN